MFDVILETWGLGVQRLVSKKDERLTIDVPTSIRI
jgi:hypothetical protein